MTTPLASPRSTTSLRRAAGRSALAALRADLASGAYPRRVVARRHQRHGGVVAEQLRRPWPRSRRRVVWSRSRSASTPWRSLRSTSASFVRYVRSPPATRSCSSREPRRRADLLRYPADRSQAPRQLHRRDRPVRRRARIAATRSTASSTCMRRRSRSIRRAARADLRHRGDPARRGPRPGALHPLPPERRARAHRARLAADAVTAYGDLSG